MSYDPPTPENNVLLRPMDGMRRDMREMMERQARQIELQNRLVQHVDEGMTLLRDHVALVRRDMKVMNGDLIQMENRILDAITEVRLLSARLDESDSSDASDLSDSDLPARPAGPVAHG